MDSSQILRQELAVEQTHVDLVYRYLDQATQSAQSVARQGHDLYKADRYSYVREEDGTALFERDAFAFQAARRLAILEAEHEGLVFGRLDQVDREIRYIGRIGVRDEEYEPLVIDWRARAAEPFYRATATHPMGVVRRRVLRCRNDQVTGIEDDLLDSSAQRDDLVIVGEGALMASLKRARGHQMRDIVATIQAEQDEAIRADYRGVTVISGGPGTGKTVVALHRAAYLLYSNRRRFERGGILVVGPSALFMNYIERVLPSLGEDSVTLRAVGQIATDVLKLSASRIDSAPAAAIKGSLRMVPLLKRLVSLPLIDKGAEKLQVTVKGNVLSLDATSLERIRRDVLTRTKANAGRRLAEESLQHALFRQLPEELGISFETAQDFITGSANYRMFVQSWWPDLVPEDVLARLSSPITLALIAEGLLSASEQAVLAGSYTAPDWSVADMALLDELMALLGPVSVAEPEGNELVFLPDGSEVSELVTTADLLTDRREAELDEDRQDTFAHILVDEAQDLSPMQWRMLRRRGPQASWTIVGDAAQSSWPDVAESQKAFTELVGSAPQREFRLSTNYRSPAEVFELAAAVVLRAYPDADLPKAVRSVGVEPELLRATGERLAPTISAALQRLSGTVTGTIGVIVPPSRWGLTAELYRDESTAALGDRLVLVTPLGAKGLEYDAVIVVSPDDIVADSPAGERVLYVCLTRATQRLTVIDVDGGGAWMPESVRK
ncbi:MAG: UvrD-helicase domain-containing protein [Propionibacteriaceae bacterium]|nr:UvrD-helicase domain-containing protein [Propionibacteriaceae bacterium]